MFRAFSENFVQALHAFVDSLGLRIHEAERAIARIGGGGFGARFDVLRRLDRVLFLFGGAVQQSRQFPVIVAILLAEILLVRFFIGDFLGDHGAFLFALLLIALDLLIDLF